MREDGGHFFLSKGFKNWITEHILIITHFNVNLTFETKGTFDAIVFSILHSNWPQERGQAS